MGNDNQRPVQPVQSVQPVQPDHTLIDVGFYFADRPEIGHDFVKLPRSQTVRHFKKLVKNLVQFDLKGYEVQYNNRILADDAIFQSFRSTIDNQEVVLIRPSIAG